jgi:DNA-binding NarL/FixJ family response regulator
MKPLPGINGLQNCEEILKLNPDQRIIVASRFSESENIKATIQLGANGFIQNPYSIDTLGRAMNVASNR